MATITNLDGCELGPIRPPSESTSLLLRVTRNCPWNKCAFCNVYKRRRFETRREEDLLAEIEFLSAAARAVTERTGVSPGGALGGREVMVLVNDPAATEEERRVALWMSRGAKNVFLQDADSLVRPAKRLVPVLERLKEVFPTVNRVTTYARSRTLVAKSDDDLMALKEAGLTRIHVGVESGSDRVLDLISKGCRAEHHVDGCRKAMRAGFQVCCYVMPGLGGRALSDEHARETARVLKEIDPHHVRLRTLWLDPGSPLHEMREQGLFEMVEEEQAVREILTMIEILNGATGELVSDHDRNLLMTVEGHLTNENAAMRQACEQFLSLPRRTRDAYIVARRSGYFLTLKAFLAEEGSTDHFAPKADDLRRLGDGSLVKGMERGLRFRRI